MKLYYDDPLIAAYMSKEFGVKFANNNTDKPLNMYLHVQHDTMDSYTTTSANCMGIHADWYDGEEIYIHPDSIGIFEPQVGDLITSKHEFELDKSDYETPSKFLIEKSDELFNLTCLSQFILTKDNYDCAWSDYHWEGQEIIQRNGKNFFMPKFEELSK